MTETKYIAARRCRRSTQAAREGRCGVNHDDTTTFDLICGMLTIAVLLATLWTLAAIL